MHTLRQLSREAFARQDLGKLKHMGGARSKGNGSGALDERSIPLQARMRSTVHGRSSACLLSNTCPQTHAVLAWAWPSC
jgi:hypothetical protein